MNIDFSMRSHTSITVAASGTHVFHDHPSHITVDHVPTNTVKGRKGNSSELNVKQVFSQLTNRAERIGDYTLMMSRKFIADFGFGGRQV
ncbi:hypothetical protein F441_03912 [Phytophthora nicotianae CJ01A1]|uniref:Uncharacterized protein n=5 Tax=Phytophthora nicotianae TaxID=4792 RepID=W2QLB9_PHYN3|nr:hypothetical protein PPTG_22303 [Phytophthora nicotianae INRA-310]ETK92930.1 hypothetical protein L915_03822 [Phytophthora nicotianae]ETP22875.1 hypothetical protein F441_03912 [Phytophthora nicotianae CJ01A1]ETP50853.1 hypothetical protein F442_03919 [Phytophthora nicotianae P10297]ETL46348.1 hypothetical protein L916_03763 [Phytophthora nicotianae]ETL99494.1 hypothetical protein L917_03678 [Phytophthora nicotianae]